MGGGRRGRWGLLLLRLLLLRLLLLRWRAEWRLQEGGAVTWSELNWFLTNLSTSELLPTLLSPSCAAGGAAGVSVSGGGPARDARP